MEPSTHFVVHSLLPLYENGDVGIKFKFRVEDYHTLEAVGKQFLFNSPKYGALAVLPWWENGFKELETPYKASLVMKGIHPTVFAAYLVYKLARTCFSLLFWVQGKEKYQEWAGIVPIE